MDEEMPIFDIDWDEISYEEREEISTAIDQLEEKTTKYSEATSTRFPEVNNDHIDRILEEGQAKATKYATNCHIRVFKGKINTFYCV